MCDTMCHPPSVRHHAVRGMVALVLAVAAGFPVGREGPMLCIGRPTGDGSARPVGWSATGPLKAVGSCYEWGQGPCTKDNCSR